MTINLPALWLLSEFKKADRDEPQSRVKEGSTFVSAKGTLKNSFGKGCMFGGGCRVGAGNDPA